MCRFMSLFKYFKRKDLPPESLLPEPSGSRIEVVNSIVKPLVKKASEECSSLAKDKGKSSVRGVYEKFSTDEKAALGR